MVKLSNHRLIDDRTLEGTCLFVATDHRAAHADIDIIYSINIVKIVKSYSYEVIQLGPRVWVTMEWIGRIWV